MAGREQRENGPLAYTAPTGATPVDRPRRTAFLIAGAYGLVAVAWIWGSDEFVMMLPLSRELEHQIEVWKGTAWVLLTAVMLYMLIARPLVRLSTARAEAQARANELATVLDAVPVAVWIARDPECRVIDGNRIGRELLGQSEPVNLSLTAPSGERPSGFKVLREGKPVAPEELPVQRAARLGQEIRDVDEEIVFEDGRRVRMLGNVVPLRDSEGRVSGAVGAFMDVTQREEALQELNHNRVILEQAQELGQIGSWVTGNDLRGGALQWSRQTCRIFGLKESEFDGHIETFFSMVHPEDREAVRQASQQAIEGRGEYAIDHRIIRRDGTMRWVHERARIERDAAGKPMRMIGVCQDITDRIAAEEARRATEARYRMIVETCQEGVWLVDRTWRTIFVNQRMAEMLGYSPEQMIGRTVLDMMPEDERKATMLRMSARERGIAEQHECRLQHADGHEIWVLMSTNPVADVQSRFDGALAMVTDISERRKMEESLRKSEAQLRLLFKSLPVPAWVFDSKSLRFLAVNEAAIAKYGYTEQEFLSRTILDIRPGAERERTLDVIANARRGFQESGGWKHVLADGRTIDVEVASHDLDFGGMSGRVVLARDVTESLRTAAELAQSEERYRHLFNALPDPAWDWDIVQDRSTFSATWSRLLGHAPGSKEAEGATWESLLHPEDRERVLASLRRCTDGSENGYEAEYRLRCQDGSYKWVLSRGSVVERDDRGRAKRMIGAITDLTSRRQAEEALRLSEARFRALIEAAPDAIVVFDLEARKFVDFNRQATRLFGLSAEVLGKQGPVELSPERQPDGRPSSEAAADYLRQAIEGGTPGFEWTHLASDGREIPCEIHLVRLPDPTRILIRGNITDITERKKAQKALRENEERLRIFIQSAPAGVAMLDRDLRYIAYSRRWLSDYGLGDQDLTGRRHYDVFPEIGERWKAIHRRCLTGVSERCEEDRFERADGGVDYLRWEIQPWHDANGEVGGLVFLTEMITERKLAEDALRASEEKYRLVLRATSDAMWDYEPATGLLRWGDNVESMFALSLADMGDSLDGWTSRLHPEDHDRAAKSFSEAIERKDERWSAEYRFRKGDGTYAVVLDRAYMLRGADGSVVRIIGAMTDVTDRRHSEELLAGQARTLEMLVGGQPLERVLDEIVLILERLEPGCIGSVMLLNEDGRTIRTAAAPNLPREYNEALNGLAIGPRVGSCGTAIHERRRVIVSDIATDPLWAGYSDLAHQHGLRACWSEPVVGAGGRVLGSLAMYYRQSRGPSDRELRSIAWASRLAGLAIERRSAEDSLRKREADLRDVLNAVPDLMFRVDRDGRYLDYHAPNLSDLYAPPDKFLGHTMEEVLPRDLSQLGMRHLARAIESGVAQTYEYQIAKKGTPRYWEVRVTRCAQEQALMLVRDITVRRSAERKLKENEQRLSLLVRQSPLGVIVWDLNFCVAEWNAAAEQIFQWTAPEALGRHANFILPDHVKPHVNAVWQALRANRGGTRSTNENVTRDGRTIYCEWYNAPLINADGQVFAVASIVDDVTEQRQAQQRQQLMMAELDHRVKNNLAAVISLAEQSGRSTSTFAAFRETFLGRVRALSRLHNALAATSWHGASLGTMVRQTLEAFGQDATSQATVSGPAVVLPARAAQAMGMALNELCTNAIKYGALSVPGGMINARWSILPPEPASPDRRADEGPPRPILELLWKERGGPRVEPPKRRGFGTELIEGSISYELGGTATTRFEPEGLCCEIRFELPKDAEFERRDGHMSTLDDQTS